MKQFHPDRDQYLDPEDPTNRKLIGWKVWYNDGSSANSKEFKWKDIPQEGIAILKKIYRDFNNLGKENEICQEMIVGQSLYSLNEKELQNIKIPSCIKRGVWMSDTLFHPLYNLARDEKINLEDL